MHPTPKGTGWIEVITGCMFSGKTEELIRRLVRARYAKQEVLIFAEARHPLRGKRDRLHSKMSLQAKRVEKAEDVWKHGRGLQVVAIDEVQSSAQTSCRWWRVLQTQAAGCSARASTRTIEVNPSSPADTDGLAARHEESRDLHAVRQPRGSEPAPRQRRSESCSARRSPTKHDAVDASLRPRARSSRTSFTDQATRWSPT